MRRVTVFGCAAPVASGAGESSGVKSPVVDGGTVKFPQVEGIDGDGAGVFEVFTLPHVFHAKSMRSPRTVRAVHRLSSDYPRTKLGLLLAGTPAKLESPSPNSVRGLLGLLGLF